MRYSKEDRETLRRSASYQYQESQNGAVKEPISKQASEVTPEKIEWIWPGRLARGKITLLEGDPGLGKSTLTIEVAARLSRGQPLPDGGVLAPMGTLFLSAEDGVADTIVPRLIAAGADLTRVTILEGVKLADGERGVTIPYDLDVIEALMLKQGCGLVVVDPLSVFLGDDINENKNQEVRKALAPAKTMLERSRVSGLFLRHLTKSQSATPVYRGAGSIGLGGAARAVMMVAEDPELPGLKVLANVKENLSRPQISLSFRVVSNEIDPDVAQIAWSGQSQWRAGDLQAGGGDDEGARLTEAKEWLADYLHGGVMAQAKAVYRAAKDDGHAERTIERAKKALGVRSVKNPSDGTWAWKLEGRHEDRQSKVANPHAHDDDLGDLGNLIKKQHNNNTFTDSSLGDLDGDLDGDLQTFGNNAKAAKAASAYEHAPWEETL